MQKNSPDIENWLKLIRSDGVGPTAFARLLKYFRSVDRALGASASELTKVKNIGPRTAESIARTRETFDVDKELALAQKLGVWIVNAADPRYPPALKQIYDPPPVIYIKGTLEKSDALAISIVGARRCSTYGSEQASRFAYLLASAGFTIVSGMARGIDTAAHRGALNADGRTIAVQGCGLNNIFPPENEKLFERISNSGACISELPLSYEPLAQNFPARNRIISGLSMGVIIIEAAHRSGALITARAALDQNREVMAVPGKVDSPISSGTNKLIKEGAKLIDCIDDVMEALGYIGMGLKTHADAAAKTAEEKLQPTLFDISKLNLNEPQLAVYNALDREPLNIEDIITHTSLPAGKVNSSLISLRLKGLIKQLPGNMFNKN